MRSVSELALIPTHDIRSHNLDRLLRGKDETVMIRCKVVGSCFSAVVIEVVAVGDAGGGGGGRGGGISILSVPRAPESRSKSTGSSSEELATAEDEVD